MSRPVRIQMARFDYPGAEKPVYNDKKTNLGCYVVPDLAIGQ